MWETRQKVSGGGDSMHTYARDKKILTLYVITVLTYLDRGSLSFPKLDS